MTPSFLIDSSLLDFSGSSSYVLDFKDEKIVPSTKNLQLVQNQKDRLSQMQLTKAEANLFNLSHYSQLNSLQAFAVAIAVIDSR